MVRVFNDNHSSASSEVGIGRQVDITDFTCEAEVKAFYLDHLGRTTADSALLDRLNQIHPFGLGDFRKAMWLLDSAFLTALSKERKQDDYLRELRVLGSGVLGQTSVIGFHSALKLPSTGAAAPRHGTLLWHGDGFSSANDPEGDGPIPIDVTLVERFARRARKQWDTELAKLSDRATGSGRGQLASAAERIERFRGFLTSKAMVRIKAAWVEWRARREATRATFFEHPDVVPSLGCCLSRWASGFGAARRSAVSGI